MNEKKIVLVALSGSVPAVITEIIWALAHQEKPVIPDEVVVLTTKKGADLIQSRLFTSLGRRGSIWDRLKAALQNEKKPIDGKLLFDETSIRIFPDAQGNPLENVRTIEDNECMADFMLSELRKYTALPEEECQVLVSITGGRNTMSALMFSCMTLVGREQDRIYHVLLNDPFDTKLNPSFYFPQKGLKHWSRGERSYHSTSAHISLFEIPYVRMKGLYQENLNKKKILSYRNLISDIQKKTPSAIDPPEIIIDLDEQAILVKNSNPLKTSVQEFVVFVLLVCWKERTEIHERAHLFFDFLLQNSKELPVDHWLYKYIEKGGASASARFERENDAKADFTKVLSSLRGKINKHPLLARYSESLAPRTKGNLTYPSHLITITKSKGNLSKFYDFLIQTKSGK